MIEEHVKWHWWWCGQQNLRRKKHSRSNEWFFFFPHLTSKLQENKKKRERWKGISWLKETHWSSVVCGVYLDIDLSNEERKWREERGKGGKNGGEIKDFWTLPAYSMLWKITVNFWGVIMVLCLSVVCVCVCVSSSYQGKVWNGWGCRWNKTDHELIIVEAGHGYTLVPYINLA